MSKSQASLSAANCFSATVPVGTGTITTSVPIYDGPYALVYGSMVYSAKTKAFVPANTNASTAAERYASGTAIVATPTVMPYIFLDAATGDAISGPVKNGYLYIAEATSSTKFTLGEAHGNGSLSLWSVSSAGQITEAATGTSLTIVPLCTLCTAASNLAAHFSIAQITVTLNGSAYALSAQNGALTFTKDASANHYTDPDYHFTLAGAYMPGPGLAAGQPVGIALSQTDKGTLGIKPASSVYLLSSGNDPPPGTVFFIRDIGSATTGRMVVTNSSWSNTGVVLTLDESGTVVTARSAGQNETPTQINFYRACFSGCPEPTKSKSFWKKYMVWFIVGGVVILLAAAALAAAGVVYYIKKHRQHSAAWPGARAPRNAWPRT